MNAQDKRYLVNFELWRLRRENARLRQDVVELFEALARFQADAREREARQSG